MTSRRLRSIFNQTKNRDVWISIKLLLFRYPNDLSFNFIRLLAALKSVLTISIGNRYKFFFADINPLSLQILYNTENLKCGVIFCSLIGLKFWDDKSALKGFRVTWVSAWNVIRWWYLYWDHDLNIFRKLMRAQQNISVFKFRCLRCQNKKVDNIMRYFNQKWHF